MTTHRHRIYGTPLDSGLDLSSPDGSRMRRRKREVWCASLGIFKSRFDLAFSAHNELKMSHVHTVSLRATLCWIQPEQASDRTQPNGCRSGFLAAPAPLYRAPLLL